MVGVNPGIIFYALQFQPALSDTFYNSQADMFYGREVVIIIFQCVKGMRVGCYDIFHIKADNRIRILLFKFLEKHLLTKSSYLVSAVFFRLAQYAEINAGSRQDPGCSPSDTLHPLIKGRHTIHKIEGIRCFFFSKHFDGTRPGKLLVFDPACSFVFRLAPWVSPFFQGP